MSHEYEESRDRNMAAPAEAATYVLTATEAISKAKSHLGSCETILGEAELGDGNGVRYSCPKKGRFLVERGPVSKTVCGSHLPKAVIELNQIRPGRYAHTPNDNGYWVSRTSTVTVKMKDGEVWR
jgi:hypothetical protein